MTPTRMRECLALLRWSQRGLADALQFSEGTVRGWARGVREVPLNVAEWLETLAAFHAANPPPPMHTVIGIGTTVRIDTTIEDWKRTASTSD